MRFLLLPASNAEKIIASLFINVLFCSSNVFLLIVIVKLMDSFSLELSKFNEGKLGYMGVVFTYFIIVSILVFSSIYFIKYYFLKLVLSIYLLGKLFSYFDQIFFKFIPNKPGNLRYSYFYSWTVWYDKGSDKMIDFFKENRVDHVYLIDSHPNLIPFAGMFILLSAIWYASFLRLKEVEI